MSSNITVRDIERDIGSKIFWIKEEQRLFNVNQKYKNLTFSDFLMTLDDFYMFTYSSKLKKSTWMVLCWLRYITRNDGFAKVSHKEMVNTFCRDGEKISSSTFFSCIDELIENEVIVKIKSKKVYNGLSQNDDNMYALISKSDIVYNMLDCIHNNPMLSTFDAYQQCIGEVVEEKVEKVKTPQPVAGSTGNKIKDKQKLKLLMAKDFRKIRETVDKFFTFLGSYNTSNVISNGRKLDILMTLKNEYMSIEFTLEEIEAAMNKTMANTVKNSRKNFKREKYMFAILNAQIEYEDEEPENSKATELAKEAEEKVKKSYFNKAKGITEEEYKEQVKKLSTILNHYNTVIHEYDEDGISGLTEKLVKMAKFVAKKFKDYADFKKHSVARNKYLTSNGIAELVEYDRKWNRVIEWVTDNDAEEPIPLSRIKELKEKNPSVFVFSKYEIFDGKEELQNE